MMETPAGEAKSYDAFISHSAKDKNVAYAIVHTLEGRGIRCWVAPRDIVPGQDWDVAVIHAIKSSRLMVLVFSAESNASPEVAKEVRNALGATLSVVPFRIQEAKLSGALEYHIGAAHWLDAINPPMEARIEELADVVQNLIGAPNVLPPRPPANPLGARSSDQHPTPPVPSRRPARLAGIVGGGLLVAAIAWAVTRPDDPSGLQAPTVEVDWLDVRSAAQADLNESKLLVEEGDYITADSLVASAISGIDLGIQVDPDGGAAQTELLSELRDERERIRTACEAERQFATDISSAPPCPQGGQP